MNKPPERTVCVVEDDDAIRRGLTDSLRFAGYGVVECADVPAARGALAGSDVDLVLLDVMLPGGSGFDLLPELRRQRPDLPVIMVTARGREEERVRGLRLGADDYVVKPFSSTELLARVEAVLRRSPGRSAGVRCLRTGEVVIHLERRCIQGHGEESSLSEREADILRYLARHRDRAVSRDELLRWVWGLDTRNLETRTVDMHVARLREKLGDPPEDARIVVTVRGTGYALGSAVEVEEAVQ